LGWYCFLGFVLLVVGDLSFGRRLIRSIALGVLGDRRGIVGEKGVDIAVEIAVPICSEVFYLFV